MGGQLQPLLHALNCGKAEPLGWLPAGREGAGAMGVVRGGHAATAAGRLTGQSWRPSPHLPARHTCDRGRLHSRALFLASLCLSRRLAIPCRIVMSAPDTASAILRLPPDSAHAILYRPSPTLSPILSALNSSPRSVGRREGSASEVGRRASPAPPYKHLGPAVEQGGCRKITCRPRLDPGCEEGEEEKRGREWQRGTSGSCRRRSPREAGRGPAGVPRAHLLPPARPEPAHPGRLQCPSPPRPAAPPPPRARGPSPPLVPQASRRRFFRRGSRVGAAEDE